MMKNAQFIQDCLMNQLNQSDLEDVDRYNRPAYFCTEYIFDKYGKYISKTYCCDVICVDNYAKEIRYGK